MCIRDRSEPDYYRALAAVLFGSDPEHTETSELVPRVVADALADFFG